MKTLSQTMEKALVQLYSDQSVEGSFKVSATTMCALINRNLMEWLPYNELTDEGNHNILNAHGMAMAKELLKKF